MDPLPWWLVLFCGFCFGCFVTWAVRLVYEIFWGDY